MPSSKSRPKKIQWIPVVAGLVRRQNQVLIGQRPENDNLAGKWEFPGGKIESGESPEEALAREMHEELGIECDIGELKLAVTHSFGDVNILILFYEILYWKGEIKNKHHLALEWVHPEELFHRQIPDANKKILKQIFQALGHPWPGSV